jgi:hypothetical protein
LAALAIQALLQPILTDFPRLPGDFKLKIALLDEFGNGKTRCACLSSMTGVRPDK